MSDYNDEFSGKCPTCGQPYLEAEIRRLRALLAEYEARHASDMEYYRGLRERIEAREDEFVEFGRMRDRIAELEANAAVTFGTLEQPTPDEPAVITHGHPPSAPPHNE